MAWDLSNYETLDSRIHKFWELFSKGRLETELIAYSDKQYIVKASVWKDINDPFPSAVDYAEEKDEYHVNLKRRTEIFDFVEEDIPDGKEGYMAIAKNAPLPKDNSFLNSVYDYGKTVLNNVLLSIQEKTKNILLFANETPTLTSIQKDGEKIYSVFDKRTSSLLYEYYLLQIFTSYIDMTDNPLMIKKTIPEHLNRGDNLFETEEEVLKL
jgi:hypothetical protein